MCDLEIRLLASYRDRGFGHICVLPYIIPLISFLMMMGALIQVIDYPPLGVLKNTPFVEVA